MKLDGGTGEVLWSIIHASVGAENESTYDMALDSSGNPIITGRMYVDSRLDEMETVKFSNVDGALIWESREGGGARLDDRSLALAVDGDDDPVVVGLLQNADGTADFMVVKYDGVSGGVLWTATETGLVNDQTGDGWVAVDDAGDVIVSWKSWGGATSYDVGVAKYAGDDGSDLWQIVYNFDGASADDPSDMILDDAGDVFIVGSSAGDYLTLKLDGDDGAMLWAQTYEGPQGWYDVANAVTLGPDGNVLVTGFSDGTGTMWDVATVSYAALDGVQQWVERWDGYDSATDEAKALVCNEFDQLFVAGYSYDDVTGMDQLVIAYDLPVGTAVDGPVPSAPIVSAFPNPFNPRVSIGFTLSRDETVRVEIFDLMGRSLDVLHDGPLATGDQVLHWDGRDADGRSLGSGAYLVRVRGEEFEARTRIVLAR